MSKVIVIGLDSVCFDVIEPWLAQGNLPNLQRLMATGVHAPLRSKIPLHTAPAWTSIMTGADIDRHGVFDYFELAADAYHPRFMNSLDVQVPYVWELAGQRGRKSIVINVPLTHPPRPFDGILIPGIMAPGDAEGYPAGIVQEVAAGIGEYRIYCPEEFDNDASLESRLGGLLDLSRMRRDAALYLARTRDWDLLVVQFQRTDSIFHILNRTCPGDLGPALRLHQAIDAFIGDIVALEPEAMVLVVSDHGMGLTEQMFAANSWLKQQGYLETRVDEAWQAFDVDNEMVRLIDAERELAQGSAFEAVLGGLARIGLTKQRLEGLLRTLHLQGLALRLVPYRLLKSQAGSESIDWEHSRAFCFHSSGGGIQINLAGREPQGIVQPGDEYEQLCDRLVAELSELRDPQGQPVFELVARRGDLYRGPEVGHIPDVVFLPRQANYKVEKRIRGGVFVSARDYYSHKVDGILIAQGPVVRAGAWPYESNPTILDVASLVLAGLGLPASTSMDRAPLLDVFTPGHVATLPEPAAYAEAPGAPAGTVAGHDESEQQVMAERLRALGYLD